MAGLRIVERPSADDHRVPCTVALCGLLDEAQILLMAIDTDVGLSQLGLDGGAKIDYFSFLARFASPKISAAKGWASVVCGGIVRVSAMGGSRFHEQTCTASNLETAQQEIAALLLKSHVPPPCPQRPPRPPELRPWRRGWDRGGGRALTRLRGGGDGWQGTLIAAFEELDKRANQVPSFPSPANLLTISSTA